MELAVMVTVILWLAVSMAAAMAANGIAKIVLAFKDRNRLQKEVKALHERGNQASKKYLENKERMEYQLMQARANENHAKWERDILVEGYQKDLLEAKKQLAVKDKLLKEADAMLARERAARRALAEE